MRNKVHFIGPRRLLFQWVTSLTILLLPWVEVRGNSLLRIDIPGRSLYLFGEVLRIQELYLVMLASLIFALFFLLITVVLGRVWCGWLCPQTTLSDIAEWAARRLGLKVQNYTIQGPLWKQTLLHGFFLFLGLLVASNFLWYFIQPRSFFSGLFTFNLHYATWITFFFTAFIIYFDLAVIRRLMCRDFCPYGRIQTSIVDRATLSLHLPEEEFKRCIECESCKRACPMGIDIRHGYQVECTDCGRCLDACRSIMTRRNEPGLIRYSFGLHGEGMKGLLNPRVLLPAFSIMILAVMLVIAISGRQTATLKVALSHTAPARQLDNGLSAIFFNGWINNRSEKKELYTLLARKKNTGEALAVKGQIQAELAPGQNRRLDFVLLANAHAPATIEFVLTDRKGMEVSTAEAYIGNPEQK